jgi:hypothetical protein
MVTELTKQCALLCAMGEHFLEAVKVSRQPSVTVLKEKQTSLHEQLPVPCTL